MASNLYPLNFKSGIKRDGTLFQADYCTNGQWVRFQRGYVRKMGGMKASTGFAIGSNITNITFVPAAVADNIDVYAAYVSNQSANIIYYQINQNFVRVVSNVSLFTLPNQPNYIWQSTLIIQGGNQKVVFLGSPSNTSINTTANATLTAYTRRTTPLPFTALPQILTGLSGLLYANPYLFVYGSNGLVQWSKATDALDFGGAGRSVNISNDKVIFGAAIRGGTNTPTILFWTLSSVVRCINTGANDITFQLDVLSKSSSILSSRCVVEYDGLFYWPGTNRFFHYNGVVQELTNTLSLNYFFNNLDMSRRQQVFGVKNTQYGEIWWFYPEKAETPGRDNRIPVGENSRALIYNIRENSWYDTSISRTGGTYSEDFGIMSTVGRYLTDPTINGLPLWRHEYETFSNLPNAIMEIPTDKKVQPRPIPSSFTTPTMSWAAFNPLKQLTGVNRWMQVSTLEPDFTLLPINTDLTVTLTSKQYAQDSGVDSAIYPIPAPLPPGSNPENAKVDIQFQGRHITFSFASTLNFEMGQVMVSIGIGDGQ